MSLEKVEKPVKSKDKKGGVRLIGLGILYENMTEDGYSISLGITNDVSDNLTEEEIEEVVELMEKVQEYCVTALQRGYEKFEKQQAVRNIILGKN